MHQENSDTDAITTRRAKELRRNMTGPERRLWARLRGGRLKGVKFKRQTPIGPYVVDFCAKSERVIIEIDGRSHEHRRKGDMRRQKALEQRGYRVLRVTNDDVLKNLDAVLEYVASHVEKQDAPSP